MGQYRHGSYVVAGSPAAVTITLGFIPDHFIVYSRAPSVNTAIARAEWFLGMANPSGNVWTTNGSGIPVISSVTTNGFAPFATGASWTATQLTITNITQANPGVVTVSSIGALVNGDTVTISSVVGMIQVNTQRYIVGGISGATFKLYDFFGNPVSTSAFGAYTSGGMANIISTPPVAPVINSTTGQVTTQGQPPGLQYDTGSAGVVIGTSVVGIANDTMDWEAFLSTPTGW